VKADSNAAMAAEERDEREPNVTAGEKVKRELISWFWVILAFMLIEGTMVQARVIPSGFSV